MQNHEKWMNKAFSDLRSARILLREDIFDTAIYHTQQCAEKSLKAFLSYKNHKILKTHDLAVLLNHCVEFDETFDLLTQEAAFLNPYAIAFRYPDDFNSVPSEQTVKESINCAEKTFNFVKEKTFELTTGQKNVFEA